MIPSNDTQNLLAIILYASLVPYLILGIRNTIRHYIRYGDAADAFFLGFDELSIWKSNPLEFGVILAFLTVIMIPLIVMVILLSWFILIPLALTTYLIVRYTIKERKKVEFLEQLKGESND